MFSEKQDIVLTQGASEAVKILAKSKSEKKKSFVLFILTFSLPE